MVAKIAVAKKLAVPCDRVWEAICRVGRLDVWFPTIGTCRVEGEGVGALRHMALRQGGEIVDRVVGIDQSRRRLIYQRDKSPFPVTAYRGTVEIFESYDSSAVVVWTVDFDSEPKDSVWVAQMLETGIGAGIDGMEKDLGSRATWK